MSVAVRYHREILRAFSPYLGERIVEVGAGSGNISALLLEREPAQLYAIEPDDRMYARLGERLRGYANAVPRKAFLSSVAHGGEVAGADSVVSVNVLEHVGDDVKELTLMHSVLRPGGHLCLWVPAIPALYSDYDRSLGHYRRYRKRELVGKLQKAGFETLHVHYRDMFGMILWYVMCRIMRQELTRTGVRLYDRLVLPLASLMGRLMKPPIGKNLIAVARKS